ncbi:AAA family ATPase [Siccirubricoccus sp. KC 17139]|uniref:AAA family ATPase n=1 Tax=Siccirubricoccus soli TaxID=2899147 RepID=A0ABT1D2E9_9PROT|nr:AAA family ATPase [Siccirubricoccus soli]MCO6416083.1 AAA family ATPase [Siccirubricoccus soli]MCP2682215.1 AAA family ATPase [Siccirubricoccus soli]
MADDTSRFANPGASLWRRAFPDLAEFKAWRISATETLRLGRRALVVDYDDPDIVAASAGEHDGWTRLARRVSSSQTLDAAERHELRGSCLWHAIRCGDTFFHAEVARMLDTLPDGQGDEQTFTLAAMHRDRADDLWKQEAGCAIPAADDALAAWRIVEPGPGGQELATAAMDAALDRLQDVLREHDTDLGAPDPFILAAGGDADAWLRLAESAHHCAIMKGRRPGHLVDDIRALFDLAGTCCWLATRRGSAQAPTHLAVLLNQVEEERRSPGHDRLLSAILLRAPGLSEPGALGNLLPEAVRRSRGAADTMGIADLGSPPEEDEAPSPPPSPPAPDLGDHCPEDEDNSPEAVEARLEAVFGRAARGNGPTRRRPRPTMRVAPDGLGAAGEEKRLRDRFSKLGRPMTLRPLPPASALAAELLVEFPWAVPVVERLRADLVLAERMGGAAYRLPPLCIVGGPGTGKSRLATRVLELARRHGGVAGAMVPVAGGADSKSIGPTARGWSTSTPSLPTCLIADADCPNPVVVVDEIDKAGGSAENGRLAQVLLAMTEPTTAERWFDEGLGAAVDLSRVTWLFLANDRSKIDPVLRTRLRFVGMPGPRPEDFDAILAGTLADIAWEFGGDPRHLPELPPEALREMRRGFAAGRLSARSLAWVVRRAVELAAEAEAGAVRH